MKEFISHFSAAYMWDIPYINSIFESKDVEDHFHKEKHYITITNKNLYHRRRNHVIHTCTQDLPRNSVVKHKDVYISSPELIFLELANYLDMHRLILLGLEMCAHSPGQPNLAITTTKKIEAFLKKTTGIQGHQKAARAIKYVKNGSGSIMESLTYMILALPNYLGGFGLSQVSFNHEINLNKNERYELGQNRCFVDLYYSESKVVIEYDSLEHHSTSVEQSEDMIRSTVLESKGYKLFRVNKIQLENKDYCLKFSKHIANKLGKRIRIRTTNFNTENRKLRRLIPKKLEDGSMNSQQLQLSVYYP